MGATLPRSCQDGIRPLRQNRPAIPLWPVCGCEKDTVEARGARATQARYQSTLSASRCSVTPRPKPLPCAFPNRPSGLTSTERLCSAARRSRGVSFPELLRRMDQSAIRRPDRNRMADCAFDYWPGAFCAGAVGALNRLISNASNPGMSEMRNPQARMALKGPPKPTIAGYIISKNPLIKATGITNARSDRPIHFIDPCR